MTTETDTNSGQTDTTTTSDQTNVGEKTFTQAEVNTMMATAKTNAKNKASKQYEGIDVNEYHQLKDAADKAVTKKQLEKGEYEQALADVTSKRDAIISKQQLEITGYKINTPILNAAAQHKAVNPEQVQSLLQKEFKLNDDGEVEVLDSKGVVRRNDDGGLYTVDARVSEFLDSNPHFVQAAPSTTNTKTNHSVTPEGELDITKLDMKDPVDRAKYNEYRKRTGLAQ